MTSNLVQKLLVAGVAVAALSVAACNKPAASADNSTPAADASAPADNSMAANNTAATLTQKIDPPEVNVYADPIDTGAGPQPGASGEDGAHGAGQAVSPGVSLKLSLMRGRPVGGPFSLPPP